MLEAIDKLYPLMKGPIETATDRAISDGIYNADVPAHPPPGKRLCKPTSYRDYIVKQHKRECVGFGSLT